MDLIQHLGVIPDPSPTLRSILYKAKGLVVLYCLLKVVVCYHFISVGCSVMKYIFPEFNDIKKVCGVYFWDLCIYLMKLNEVQINVIGDAMTPESAVLICNHQSLADHILLAYLARNTSSALLTLPRINFFSWFSLWTVPTVKLLSHMAKCDENWELDKPLTDVFFDKVLGSKNPEWIVLFPEVNIWTQNDYNLHRQQSEKFYLPITENILYPRFSSFYNIISTFHNKKVGQFSNLYDVSIVYQRASGPAPTFLQIFSCSEPITVTIHVKLRSLSRVPIKRKRLERWLEHTWVAKDKLITQIRANTQVTEPTNASFVDVPLSSMINIPLRAATGSSLLTE